MSFKSVLYGRVTKLLLLALVCALSVQTVAAADAGQIYQDSTDALYNLDFSTAEHGYETLTRDFPDNPDYWNALGASLLFKAMYDQQKLNIESYSGSSLGTKDSQDTVNQADEKRVRETLSTAMAKANAILKKDPNNIRGLYALGVSNATLASFEGTIKRSYVAAHSRAKMARDLHEQVLKLDPTYDDARLAVGTYNYVIGVIPTLVRWVLSPFGVHGEGKEIGIQQLETAAAKGKNTSTDAKVILLVLYNREKRYDDSLRLVNELQQKYPRNFLLDLTKATIYRRMEKWDDVVQVYEQLLGKVQAGRDGFQRLREGRIYYALGTTHVDREQFEKALEDFMHVVATRDSPPNEKANSYLWMGKIFDSKNDRMKAIEQYDLLLELDCDPGLKAEARRYKRRPYGNS